MGVEDNKALIRRFYAEIDAGNIDAMDEIVAEDYVDHHPPPFPGLARGREGLKEAFRIFWEATPGRHEIEDQIAEGDKVVTRLTAYGRHERDLPGPLPATGASFRSSCAVRGRWFAASRASCGWRVCGPSTSTANTSTGGSRGRVRRAAGGVPARTAVERRPSWLPAAAA